MNKTLSIDKFTCC